MYRKEKILKILIWQLIENTYIYINLRNTIRNIISIDVSKRENFKNINMTINRKYIYIY